MNELKPCPFCGAEAKVEDYGEFKTVRCSKLSMLCPNPMMTVYDDNFDYWNTRTKSECNTYDIAKVCFDDIIDEDMLCEMKYQKMIASVEGFKAACIAQIQLAIESALPPKDPTQ